MSARRQVLDEDIRIDRLARNLYGLEKGGTVEALLDANPGLAALCSPNGLVPAGTGLFVPEIVARSASTSTRPWD